MSSTINIQFVAPAGSLSNREQLQHIAIQATAVMMQSWFAEEDVPEPRELTELVSAVMAGFLKSAPQS